MGVIIPNIPYKSQSDPDATLSKNDCGPTCVAMILNGLDKNVTTNAVFRRTGCKPTEYVSMAQMINAARTYGVTFQYKRPWSLEDLMQSIMDGKPVIPLVHYGAWSQIEPGVSTQSTFTGPHFVVVVGFDDEYIYVNDPLFWDTSTVKRRQEGEHKAWTYEQFLAAWGSAHKDGSNHDYGGIYCAHALPVVSYGGPPVPEVPDQPPPPPVEPEPVYQINPVMKRRIQAWAAYNKAEVPQEITSPAVETAFAQTMGNWGMRVTVHTVTASDTLPLIALKYYDDPLKWDVLVYFNGMTFQDPIHDGDTLIIPEPLEVPVVIPEELIPSDRTRGINFMGHFPR